MESRNPACRRIPASGSCAKAVQRPIKSRRSDDCIGWDGSQPSMWFRRSPKIGRKRGHSEGSLASVETMLIPRIACGLGARISFPSFRLLVRMSLVRNKVPTASAMRGRVQTMSCPCFSRKCFDISRSPANFSSSVGFRRNERQASSLFFSCPWALRPALSPFSPLSSLSAPLLSKLTSFFFIFLFFPCIAFGRRPYDLAEMLRGSTPLSV
mmetsp:Transcript_22260/g.54436  ORF Transcript_22260/g.54436 Transcript_22260/m.54436 type:complete len:211 (+) Transcript_22260:2232-2864(+)